MTEPDEAAILVEDEDLVADDPEDGLGLEPAPPSIEPGPRRLVVPEGEVVRRVDRFVADRTGLSRSYVQRLIAEGRLVDDEGHRLRANSEVRGGAVTLEVPPPEVPYHLEPDPTIEVVVVYEDEDLLIVDKPAGLVVHPAPGHADGTLVNALLAHGDGATWGGIAGVQRPGIVQRLGRGGPDRGADRARPQAPDADGGRPRRAAVGHRVPGPGAVRRLDAARA